MLDHVESLDTFFASVSLYDRKEITSSIQSEVNSFLSDQLDHFSAPEINSVADSAIGAIEYALGDIKITSNANMQDDSLCPDVEVNLLRRSIKIQVRKLKLDIQEFTWSYKQTIFPFLSAKGTASAGLSDCKIVLNFQLISRGMTKKCIC